MRFQLFGVHSALFWLAAFCATPSFAQDKCLETNVQSEPDKAVQYCTQKIEADSWENDIEAADTFAQRGIALRELKQFEASEADLLQAITFDEAPNILRMLAWTYREDGKLAKAERIYTRVLKKDDHWQGWLSRCVVRLDMNQPRKALGDCKEALSQDPNNPDTLFFLARAYNQTDQPQNAIKIALTGQEQYPETARFYTEEIWGLYFLNQDDAAFAKFTTARQRFPDDSDVLYLQDTLFSQE